jgi:3-phosphoshikimate 1-carboxyvinyltransferase
VSTPADERVFGGARPLRGTLHLPGDKSISHRALLFAALATGQSRITNLSTGADVRATRRALEHLGVRVRVTRGGPVTVRAGGVDGFGEPEDVIECGNSGTSMRVLAGLLAGRSFMSVLTGDASLRRRPMRRVVEPLRAMGAKIDGRDGGDRAPLVVRGGDLEGGRHELAVASAQVKAALVLAGMQADGSTTISTPAPTRDHTERMLRAMGAPLEADGVAVTVRRGAPDPFEIEVPGDVSSAAFFVVGAAITPGSDLSIEGVSLNPTRIGFVDVLRRMGAMIETEVVGEELGEPFGTLRVRHSPLGATTIAGDEIPIVQDEVPILAVAAAFADGVTEVHDASELAIKETDRLGAIAQELGQLGVGVETMSDGLTIRGGRPQPGPLKSHGDHRMAMAAAIAANALDGPSQVRGWGCVLTSYPEFADDLAALTQGW